MRRFSHLNLRRRSPSKHGIKPVDAILCAAQRPKAARLAPCADKRSAASLSSVVAPMPGSRKLFGFRFFSGFQIPRRNGSTRMRRICARPCSLGHTRYLARCISANWATTIASCSPVDSYDDKPMRHKSLIYCMAVQAPKLRRIRSVLKKPAVL